MPAAVEPFLGPCGVLSQLARWSTPDKWPPTVWFSTFLCLSSLECLAYFKGFLGRLMLLSSAGVPRIL
eukprot:scaffold25306_cov17-Tisochrysis_lutea.AAC.2